MEFVLIRHSLTPGNLEKQYVGSTDQPLAPEGEALARERRERMPEVDGIWVSPLKRCRQTAELLFPGMEQRIVPDLQECDFGDYECKTWEELKELARQDVAAARSTLEEILSNYQGYKQCVVILVFDAYKVKGGLGSVEKYHNITIVYTKEAETADAYIERATYEIGRQHRVRVATSDGPEQIIILGHGALRLSASAFHEEMMEVQKQIGDTVWQNNRKNANSGAVRAAMEKAKEGGGC